MRLRRPDLLGAMAWVLATAMGIGVAWFGLRPVLDAAVPDRADPPSAAEVKRLAVPPPIAVPAPTRPPSGASGPSGSASASASRSGSASAVPASPGRSTARPPASSPPVVVDGWTVTTEADGSRSYLRSFRVPGGSTVIRMVPGRVSLVSATPSPGYSVTTGQPDPTRLVVQFSASARYDIVDALWWNDHPYAEISNVG